MTKQERIADLRRSIASAKTQIEATEWSLYQQQTEVERLASVLADLESAARRPAILAAVRRALTNIDKHRRDRGETWPTTTRPTQED